MVLPQNGIGDRGDPPSLTRCLQGPAPRAPVEDDDRPADELSTQKGMEITAMAVNNDDPPTPHTRSFPCSGAPAIGLPSTERATARGRCQTRGDAHLGCGADQMRQRAGVPLANPGPRWLVRSHHGTRLDPIRQSVIRSAQRAAGGRGSQASDGAACRRPLSSVRRRSRLPRLLDRAHDHGGGSARSVAEVPAARGAMLSFRRVATASTRRASGRGVRALQFEGRCPPRRSQ
jgi:hypothetical protein